MITNPMLQRQNRWLFWTPRILAILYALFIGLFSLDVFGLGYGFWQTLGALLIHLLPSLVMLAVLAIAWRWERLGGVLFIILGMLLGFWWWSSVLAVPLLLIGVLFVLSGHNKKEARAH